MANTPLVLFRILLGLTLSWFALCDWPATAHTFRATPPRFRIGFELTRFLPELSESALRVLCRVELLACLGLTLGLPGCALYICLLRTYFMLSNRARYQNHIYLLCLLPFLFSVLNADRVEAVGRWQILLMQGQVCVVYFFGAINKVNPDWLLRGMPIASSLKKTPYRWLHDKALVFAWAGLLFDFCAAIMLMVPATRLLILLPFVGFHAFNQWFYSLGVFPYLNYASLALFVPETPAGSLPVAHPGAEPLLFFFSYAAVQLLVPVRRLLHPRALNSDHHRHFSWTMKLLRHKVVVFRLETFDRTTLQTIGPVDLRPFLSRRSIAHVSTSPRALAMALERIIPCMNYSSEVGVRVHWEMSYNHLPPRQIADPSADLRDQKVLIFGNYPWHRL